jgi:hypothetical protein
MRLGLNDRGAAYLADLEPLKQFRDRPDGAVLYRGWLYGAGDWARHCGDYGAASDYYTAGLDLDRSAGSLPGVQRATIALGKCDRASSPGRTISLPN